MRRTVRPVVTYAMVVSRIFTAVLLLCALGAPAGAQLYKWRDEQGRIHFTDNYQNIPPQYRKDNEYRPSRPKPAAEPDTRLPAPQESEEAPQSGSPPATERPSQLTGMSWSDTRPQAGAQSAIVKLFQDTYLRGFVTKNVALVARALADDFVENEGNMKFRRNAFLEDLGWYIGSASFIGVEHRNIQIQLRGNNATVKFESVEKIRGIDNSPLESKATHEARLTNSNGRWLIVSMTTRVEPLPPGTKVPFIENPDAPPPPP